MKKMKLGKASQLSEINMEMINASGKLELTCDEAFVRDYFMGKEC